MWLLQQRQRRQFKYYSGRRLKGPKGNKRPQVSGPRENSMTNRRLFFDQRLDEKGDGRETKLKESLSKDSSSSGRVMEIEVKSLLNLS